VRVFLHISALINRAAGQMAAYLLGASSGIPNRCPAWLLLLGMFRTGVTKIREIGFRSASCARSFPNIELLEVVGNDLE